MLQSTDAVWRNASLLWHHVSSYFYSDLKKRIVCAGIESIEGINHTWISLCSYWWTAAVSYGDAPYSKESAKTRFQLIGVVDSRLLFFMGCAWQFPVSTSKIQLVLPQRPGCLKYSKHIPQHLIGMRIPVLEIVQEFEQPFTASLWHKASFPPLS